MSSREPHQADKKTAECQKNYDGHIRALALTLFSWQYLKTEPRASSMPGKDSATEYSLNPQAPPVTWVLRI